MKQMMKNGFFALAIAFTTTLQAYQLEGLPLFYWQKKGNENFGDYLSLKLVERIVGGEVINAHDKNQWGKQKMLAIGSILVLAKDGDLIWGTGMNGKRMDLDQYQFHTLDVRAVRGPMTRDFLINNFNIDCPEIYGDPALLLPYFFPEFAKKENPKYDYLIIPHYSEEKMFPKELYPNVVYPTEPWNEVIKKIVDRKFVISSSLHGLIVADAYGIPARYLKISDHEPLYKYRDYYLSTNRPEFNYATSVEEALNMGGEAAMECDLEKLYFSFPFEFWPNATFNHPNFE